MHFLPREHKITKARYTAAGARPGDCMQCTLSACLPAAWLLAIHRKSQDYPFLIKNIVFKLCMSRPADASLIVANLPSRQRVESSTGKKANHSRPQLLYARM